MNIIGIHDGHNSGASLIVDGELKFAIAEERLTRNKNEYGFPIKSINYCLNKYQLKKKDIHYIAVSTINLPPKYFAIKRNTSMSISDYINEQEKYWYPKIDAWYPKNDVGYPKIDYS